MSIVRIRLTALAVLSVASLASAAGWAQTAAPTTSQLVDPRNGGVAGTGLGTVPKTGGKPSSTVPSGTGDSVSGPPGQGIQGRGGEPTNAAPQPAANP